MVRNQVYHVSAGHLLTVSVFDGNAHVRQIEDATVGALVTNDAPVSFGPYLLPRSFRVQDEGNASVTIAESDMAANIPSDDEKAFLDAVPAEDQEDGATVWNDEGTLKVSTSA